MASYSFTYEISFIAYYSNAQDIRTFIFVAITEYLIRPRILSPIVKYRSKQRSKTPTHQNVNLFRVLYMSRNHIYNLIFRYIIRILQVTLRHPIALLRF
jgi:hypothetical protein